MRRILSVLLALAVASCVPAVVKQEEPVSISVVPVPSGGAPMYFPGSPRPHYVTPAGDIYVGYPELHYIQDAVMMGDSLVIRGSSGVLLALDLTDGRRRVLAEGVHDTAVSPGRVWFVRSARPDAGAGDPPAYDRFLVSSWDGVSVRDRTPIVPRGPDRLQALIVSGGAPVLILARSVFTTTTDGDGWREIGLDGELPSTDPGRAAMASTGELYVGSDFGEFGGGLQRVDLATGTITGLCREPWRMCDNVSAIVPDPRQPGCVIVAEGLWHMASVSGRVVRVCRDRADVLLRRPLAKDPLGTGGIIFGTEEFADLAVTSDGRIWAAGMGAIYEFDGDTKVRHPLPPLEPLDQLYAIRSFPGLIVLFDGAGVTCGDTLRDRLPAGSAPMPSPDACGFWMASWSPMLVAVPAPGANGRVGFR